MASIIAQSALCLEVQFYNESLSIWDEGDSQERSAPPNCVVSYQRHVEHVSLHRWSVRLLRWSPFFTRQGSVRLKVSLASILHYVVWDFYVLASFQSFSYEPIYQLSASVKSKRPRGGQTTKGLLVVGILTFAHFICVCIPETRAIWCKDFVNERYSRWIDGFV